MSPEDIAFKCNFAFMEPSTSPLVTLRRVSREFDWGVPLCSFLDGLSIPGHPNV